jgi:integrase
MDMTRIKLRYLTSDRSDGVTRYYVRTTGHPKIRVYGQPGSADFMAGYHKALEKIGKPDEASRKRSPGSLDAAIMAYYASAAFVLLSGDRKKKLRSILGSIARDAGDRRIAHVTYADLVLSRDKRAAKPAAADHFVKAIRAVFKHALDIGLITTNPARDLKQLRVRTEGHHVATLSDIGKFFECHQPGSAAHLAACLLLFTAARPCDAIQIGRQHIQSGRIVFRPSKTAKSSAVEVNMRIAGPLAAAIEESGPRMTLLVTESGEPFASAKAFCNRVKKWWVQAGVTEATAYSFRKGAATIMGDDGASDLSLMAMCGWTSREQAGTYTRRTDRARLADAAISALERGVSGTQIVPPPEPIVLVRRKTK